MKGRCSLNSTCITSFSSGEIKGETILERHRQRHVIQASPLPGRAWLLSPPLLMLRHITSYHFFDGFVFSW